MTKNPPWASPRGIAVGVVAILAVLAISMLLFRSGEKKVPKSEIPAPIATDVVDLGTLPIIGDPTPLPGIDDIYVVRVPLDGNRDNHASYRSVILSSEWLAAHHGDTTGHVIGCRVQDISGFSPRLLYLKP